MSGRKLSARYCTKHFSENSFLLSALWSFVCPQNQRLDRCANQRAERPSTGRNHTGVYVWQLCLAVQTLGERCTLLQHDHIPLSAQVMPPCILPVERVIQFCVLKSPRMSTPAHRTVKASGWPAPGKDKATIRRRSNLPQPRLPRRLPALPRPQALNPRPSQPPAQASRSGPESRAGAYFFNHQRKLHPVDDPTVMRTI